MKIYVPEYTTKNPRFIHITQHLMGLKVFLRNIFTNYFTQKRKLILYNTSKYKSCIAEKKEQQSLSSTKMEYIEFQNISMCCSVDMFHHIPKNQQHHTNIHGACGLPQHYH